MNKSRLEAFTDAIIAIAATIMVLELKPPEEVTLKALASDWTVFFAYLVSFVLIYTVWFSHHNAFKKAKTISVKTYLFNGAWLFCLTLVPFTTAWVGENTYDVLPEILYVTVLFFWSLAFQLMDNQIVHDNPEIKKDSSNNITNRTVLYGGYIVSLAGAFIYPISCIILVGVVSIIMTIRMLKYGTN